MQRFKPRLAVTLSLLALSCVACAQGSENPATQAPASTPADPLNRPAEVMPLADRSLILDVTKVGERYVAVGERGHVLLSDDGVEWTQSAHVPLRSTLTAVSAIGADVWAVGHDGVILHSGNAGENWEIQRHDPHGIPGDTQIDELRQGVPLLDVLFTDINHGIAIGAYSLLLRTADGGKTWTGARINAKDDGETANAEPDANAGSDAHSDNELQSSVFSDDELKIGRESDPHLNAIARTGSGGYVIVGERGALFRSRDGGESWERGQLPYDGSMFGVLGYDGQHVIAFGLRGHVFESTDLGVNWTEVATGTELSLMGGAATADGGAVIVGANGIVLQRARGSDALTASTLTAAGIIANVLPIGADGELLIASENGISRYQPK